MTNGRGEPTLAAELASADRVDLLCTFVEWQGLRLLEGPLTELCERGVGLPAEYPQVSPYWSHPFGWWPATVMA